MKMRNNNSLLALLRVIGSPLTSNNSQVYIGRNDYGLAFYSIADVIEIPLTYLETVIPLERKRLPEYSYYHNRLRRLMEVAVEISELFNKRGINYAIFKTLRTYPEDVSDIDLLNLGSPKDYENMLGALRSEGIRAYGEGGFCNIFRDYKMHLQDGIDIYLSIRSYLVA